MWCSWLNIIFNFRIDQLNSFITWLRSCRCLVSWITRKIAVWKIRHNTWFFWWLQRSNLKIICLHFLHELIHWVWSTPTQCSSHSFFQEVLCITLILFKLFLSLVNMVDNVSANKFVLRFTRFHLYYLCNSKYKL